MDNREPQSCRPIEQEMKKFTFRMERVLEYRRLQEGWAKDAYIEARAARLDAEATISALHERRDEAISKVPNTIEDRQALDRYLLQLEDEEGTQKHIAGILAEEEANALTVWQERKQELEAMVKLKEKAKEEYDLEANRAEQAELDEWTTTRRAA